MTDPIHFCHCGDPHCVTNVAYRLQEQVAELTDMQLQANAEHEKELNAKQDDLDVQLGQLQESRRQVAELTAKLAEKERENIRLVTQFREDQVLIGRIKNERQEKIAQAYNAEVALAEARKDSERIEKLRWYVVNVRKPMRHGSLNIFYANPSDGDEEDETPSDLREQIDALPPAPSN